MAQKEERGGREYRNGAVMGAPWDLAVLGNCSSSEQGASGVLWETRFLCRQGFPQESQLMNGFHSRNMVVNVIPGR